MLVAGLRALVLNTNLAVFGVPAVVTRPAPNNTPISTTGIWAPALPTEQPAGNELFRLEPKRIFVVPRADVPFADKGTEIVAADTAEGAAKTWLVDGLAADADPQYLRLAVRQKHT